MRTIVKICGLSTEETLDAAIAAGADMVGLNFYPKSPRYVSPERAASLAARVRGNLAIVALTVDVPLPALADLVATVEPDWLQLHGAEDEDTIRAARRTFGRPVMRAVGVAGAADLAAAARFAAVADRVLLDAKPPKGPGALPGGNGIAFDWDLLAGLAPGPYMLSGGLSVGNVAEALAAAPVIGVDVSSGVERAPGVKDPDLIHAFVSAVRAVGPLAARSQLESIPT